MTGTGTKARLHAMKRFEFAGKTVLITGASMGIGAEFARQLVQRGASVVLVARSEDKLARLAAEIGSAHVIAADLAANGAAGRVYEAVAAKGLEIDVLVNNAGFGLHGRFEELPRASQRDEIDLNVGALVELTHVFLPMIERRQGGFIQVASMAGLTPVPYMAVYGATKSFVLSFSAALWAEYRERGVRVMALVPGATDTPFFERSGEAAAAGTKKARPEDVVRDGLDGFAAGKATAVNGVGNRVTSWFAGMFSREMAARITARMTAPKDALVTPRRDG